MAIRPLDDGGYIRNTVAYNMLPVGSGGQGGNSAITTVIDSNLAYAGPVESKRELCIVDRILGIKNSIASLGEQLGFLESLPKDDYEAGNVVVFSKIYDTELDKTYTYAAVKRTDGNWSVTGRTEWRTWDNLLDMIYTDRHRASIEVSYCTKFSKIK